MTHAQELPDIDPTRDHPEHHMKWTSAEIKWIKAYAQRAVDEALKAREPMTEAQALEIARVSVDCREAIRRTEAHHNITSKE